MAKKRKKKGGFPLAKLALVAVGVYLITRPKQTGAGPGSNTPTLPGGVYTDPVPQPGSMNGKQYFLIA